MLLTVQFEGRPEAVAQVTPAFGDRLIPSSRAARTTGPIEVRHLSRLARVKVEILHIVSPFFFAPTQLQKRREPIDE
jgi:hypothetical protein